MIDDMDHGYIVVDLSKPAPRHLADLEVDAWPYVAQPQLNQRDVMEPTGKPRHRADTQPN